MARRDDVENESAPAVVAAPSFVLLTKAPESAPLRDIPFDELESVTRLGGWIVSGYYYATWSEPVSSYDRNGAHREVRGMRYLVAQTNLATTLAETEERVAVQAKQRREAEEKLAALSKAYEASREAWSSDRRALEFKLETANTVARGLEIQLGALSPTDSPAPPAKPAEEGDDHVAF